MIDTLKYSRELENAGFDTKQSELLVRSQIAMIMDNVATKADLQDIRNEIHSVRYEMNDRFKDVNHRIDLVFNQVTEMNKKFEFRFAEMNKKFEFRFTEMDKSFESRLDGQNAEFSLKVEKMTNKLGVIVISSMSALGVLISGLGIIIKYF